MSQNIEPHGRGIIHLNRDGPTTLHVDAQHVPGSRPPSQLGQDVVLNPIPWETPASEIETQLVDDLPNEDLWLLLRRFSNQTYHVKRTNNIPPGELDLNFAKDREFSPDKLRGAMERLYMTVIISAVAAVKQILRLRSWREPRRTGWFCVVYTIAWLFDLLIPTVAIFFTALIMFPGSRAIFFPLTPIVLVSSVGKIDKAPEGATRSSNSITGAPEAHRGEAIEAEASHFVTGIARISLASFSVPQTNAISSSFADANTRASGNYPLALHEVTKTPMEELMWAQLGPLMHALCYVADTWERFANALAPAASFSKGRCKRRLSGFILSLAAACYLTPSYIIGKSITLGIGFAFFGRPLIITAQNWLDRSFPHWAEELQLSKSVLKGVPTNAQLTIALLRIAEAEDNPLPPPPDSESPEDPSAEVIEEQTQVATTHHLLNPKQEADDTIGSTAKLDPGREGGVKDTDTEAHEHHRLSRKIFNLLRGTAKAGVKTAIATDSVMAKAGSSSAKRRLGLVPRKDGALHSGPNEFAARFEGQAGYACILADAAGVRCIAFASDKKSHHRLSISGPQPVITAEEKERDLAWCIPISSLTELKKQGGYGWKTKLAVSWALERTIHNGLVVVDGVGKEWELTAMPLRDELFNRLASIGGQRWESL